MRVIADVVLGVLQVKDGIVYIDKNASELRLWRWESYRDKADLLLTFASLSFNRPYSLDNVTKVIFGASGSWRSQIGLLAMQFGRQHWLVGIPAHIPTMGIVGLSQIAIAKKCKVIAPLSSRQLAGMSPPEEYGLLILSKNRRVIRFQSKSGGIDVLESASAIRQIRFECNTGLLAYLTEFPQRLVVIRLSDKQELLRIDFQPSNAKVRDASV